MLTAVAGVESRANLLKIVEDRIIQVQDVEKVAAM